MVSTTWAKIFSAIFLILYGVISLILLFVGLNTTIALVLGLGMLFLTFLTLLYLVGIQKKNDWIMIPFVVSEMIIRVFIGFLVGAIWIAYLLALFDLVQFESPFESIGNLQFLFLFALGATLSFALWIRLLLVFYDGYRKVKKENDRKRMEKEASEHYYMRITTARPSKI
ncbi:unnamed protein product [Bursaphelenchus xylophilus]|uniref:(pine wood nematode) hypothetical protein n=1 Tax=Bursaphelenchus xylophilus TaxID=6326 RepID=A0A1I7SLJ4_BURXY|nr:unnamed protein product [Bursaphelenchus xylophilus]CAG9129640.1 unnamed protein product [Bursaphelenchus xylophilus]